MFLALSLSDKKPGEELCLWDAFGFPNPNVRSWGSDDSKVMYVVFG
jgi:hypothetical protein